MISVISPGIKFNTMAFISRRINKDYACEFFYLIQKLAISIPLQDMF